MSTISPLVCGSITVTWRQDGSVDAITYESESLSKAVNDRLQQLQLGPLGIILPACAS